MRDVDSDGSDDCDGSDSGSSSSNGSSKKQQFAQLLTIRFWPRAGPSSRARTRAAVRAKAASRCPRCSSELLLKDVADSVADGGVESVVVVVVVAVVVIGVGVASVVVVGFGCRRRRRRRLWLWECARA